MKVKVKLYIGRFFGFMVFNRIIGVLEVVKFVWGIWNVNILVVINYYCIIVIGDVLCYYLKG